MLDADDRKKISRLLLVKMYVMFTKPSHAQACKDVCHVY